MEINQIATKEDILRLEKNFNLKMNELLQTLKIEKNASNTSKNYLRTKGARALLNVSENKLRTMRENGEIPFSFIGSTYYYPEEEILKLLEENTIRR